MVVKLVQKKHNNYNHIMITVMIITIKITRSIYMAIFKCFLLWFHKQCTIITIQLCTLKSFV